MDFFASILDILFLTLWIFVMVAFFVVIIRIIMDIFRDQELGGLGKTLWTIFVILLPVLGALIYLIARGRGMSRRDAQQAASVHAAQVEYTKNLMSEAGPAGEIKAAKELLDSGAISQEEFEALKAKALSK
ncbi:SHOCT domain-containing protein [Demequina globuliformis]|uniref:SHOCT domain-containing protein n=1 Tax=Demequina globuliformis TaxID=676202 RepID=UPI000AEAE089|nr:SHOCT domain-containing protein [Demequina globuliformis]